MLLNVSIRHFKLMKKMKNKGKLEGKTKVKLFFSTDAR
jgi:hypothetical protein